MSRLGLRLFLPLYIYALNRQADRLPNRQRSISSVVHIDQIISINSMLHSAIHNNLSNI